MTFEEWVASNPLQVRRDLYEHVWVRRLCDSAFAEGEKKGAADEQERVIDICRNGTFRKFDDRECDVLSDVIRAVLGEEMK